MPNVNVFHLKVNINDAFHCFSFVLTGIATERISNVTSTVSLCFLRYELIFKIMRIAATQNVTEVSLTTA